MVAHARKVTHRRGRRAQRARNASADASAEKFAGRGDVVVELGLELVDAVEAAFAAEEVAELDPGSGAVQIA